MEASVTCASCHARIRADRVRCLRCKAPLRPLVTGPRGWTRRVATGVAGMLAGVAIVTWRLSPQVADVTIAPRTVAVVAAPRPSAAAPRAPELRPVPPAAAAQDAIREGVAAYRHADIDAAVDRFRRSVEADPDNGGALNNLGQALVRAGRPEEALPFLRRAVAARPREWAYRFNLARAHARLAEWPAAVAEYRAADALIPDDYATQFNLAQALHADGRLGDALAAFERAIALAPDEHDFHLAYGRALEAARRPHDAAAAYRRFLQAEPGTPQAAAIASRIARLEQSSRG